MIIQEKLKAMATADTTIFGIINARFFTGGAPQGATVPHVVLMMREEVLMTHNNALETTRPWKAYLYAVGSSPLQAHQIGRALKNLYVGYKHSEPGASDTDIQAITIDTGLVDLERTAEAKEFPVSLVLDVWEQLA